MENARTRREGEIWRACDELWAQHAQMKAVTGDAIRDRLTLLGYKRGSPNEIYKYRHTWKLSRHIRDDATGEEGQAAENSPSDPISRAVYLVQQELKAEAQTQIAAQAQLFATEKEALGAEVEAIQQRYARLAEEKEGLQKQLTESQNQAKALLKEKEALQEQLADTRQLAALVQGRLDGSQNQLAEQLRQHESALQILQKSHAAELAKEEKRFQAYEVESSKAQETLKAKLADLGEKAMEESNFLKMELRQKETEIVRLENQLQKSQSDKEHALLLASKEENRFEALQKNHQTLMGNQSQLSAGQDRLISAIERAQDALAKIHNAHEAFDDRLQKGHLESSAIRHDMMAMLKLLKDLQSKGGKESAA